MTLPENIHKLPRLFTEQTLSEHKDIIFSSSQLHYLKNVLRQNEGNFLRVFNGRDGEFLATITALNKKDGRAKLAKCIKPQPAIGPARALYFAPIKKNRMDFLIEKAVELGVTSLHPVLTARTETRKINEERLQAQIIEAAEQCERLTIPALAPLTKLENVIGKKTPLYACIERAEGMSLRSLGPAKDAAFLIGPEGGFTPDEIEMLNKAPQVTALSLGENILRAETAAIKCLAGCL